MRALAGRALLSDEILSGLRDSAVTRLFIDPAVDAESGDVHGKILRLSPLTWSTIGAA